MARATPELTGFDTTGGGMEAGRRRRRAHARSAALPLLLLAVVLILTGRSMAQPVFAYALTTPASPVQPGQIVRFTVTVTNLTGTLQNLSELDFQVPAFTTYKVNNFPEPAGSALSVGVGNVAPGASVSRHLDFTVLAGNQSPPDGSIITLTLQDLANAGSVSRSVRVQAGPTVTLNLSTTRGTVAPGGVLAYTFSYHNAGGVPVVGVRLGVALPAGATFLSADGAAVLGTDRIVRWPLGTLAAGATGQVQLSLRPTPATVNAPALLLQAALHDGSGRLLAQASDAKPIYAIPTFSYVLTTPANSVQPGQIVRFTVTVTNLSGTLQNLSALDFQVPVFTTYKVNNFPEPAGSAYQVEVGNVAPGASVSTYVDLTVPSGNQSPPDGSLFTLALADPATGASVSRTVTVNAVPAATLALSTQQGTVKSGDRFVYTITYHNAGRVPVAGAQLAVAVPGSASFLLADHGGVLGPDRVVRWPLGTLAAGATGQVNVTLQATPLVPSPQAMLVQATLRDVSARLLAQAVDAKPFYPTPTFSYALTTATNTVQPGQIVRFTVTVTNLSGTLQNLSALDFQVPVFTTYVFPSAANAPLPAGSAYQVGVGNVAPQSFVSRFVDVTVLSANQSPPAGSIITLVLLDRATGASVSHSVTVQ